MTYESLRERVAQQFRFAYQGGACDPKECYACDCNMDDEGRKQIAGLSMNQAEHVINWVRREYS